MKTRLYRIIFAVRRTLGHPDHSPICNSMLCVYLFAESLEEANAKATGIVEYLPYEFIHSKVMVTHSDIPAPFESEEASQAHETAIAMAWQVGIGFMMFSRPGEQDGKWIDDYFAAHT
jgi:hypothetical protein